VLDKEQDSVADCERVGKDRVALALGVALAELDVLCDRVVLSEKERVSDTVRVGVGGVAVTLPLADQVLVCTNVLVGVCVWVRQELCVGLLLLLCEPESGLAVTELPLSVWTVRDTVLLMLSVQVSEFIEAVKDVEVLKDPDKVPENVSLSTAE